MSPETTRHITRWNDADLGRTGYWGTPTAALDWCELNYSRTIYLAEAFNTVSNFVFMALALLGAIAAIQQQLPKRFVVSHTGVLIIGIGSAMFHATLLYACQILDELPMILVSSLLAWIVFDTRPLAQPPNLVIPSLLFAFDVFFTYAYLSFPNPVFHQVAYGILAVGVVLRGAQLLLYFHVGHRVNKQARRLIFIGSATFVLGFALWNADNIWCNSHVSPWKERFGAPISWLLEGHAWWHLLTGLGSYNVIQSLCLITLAIRDSPDHFDLGYMAGVLPYVQRTPAGWAAIGVKPDSTSVPSGERQPLLAN